MCMWTSVGLMTVWLDFRDPTGAVAEGEGKLQEIGIVY